MSLPGEDHAITAAAQKAEVPGLGAERILVLERALMQLKEISVSASEPAILGKVTARATAEGPIIGIDLGTTNSAVSIVERARPRVIPSRRGYNTIPSVVALSPMGELLVGHAAKSQMEINPKNTIYGSKRMVGRPFDSPIVRAGRDRFHYEIVPGKGNLAAIRMGERIMSLEEVSAKILEELRNVAQEHLERPVERAVITVPAYYNENQRRAIRRAGALAGLKVERILNEPTAAALTYGYKRLLTQKVFVYDLGGGTFDASILEINGNVYEVLATGGDIFLGGLDFDSQIMDYVLLQFHGHLGRLPLMERASFLRVLQGAECAKCLLSTTREARVHLPCIGYLDGKPVDLDVQLSKAEIEELVVPLIRRTLEVCDAVMARAGLRREDLDAILLVGGQTRMPLVQSMLREHFAREPIKGVHPDEAVALGAALAEGEASSGIDGVFLIDVLPMTVGIGYPGGRFFPVLSNGTTTPTTRTLQIPTAFDNQGVMVFPVFQGTGQLTLENECLGCVHIPGLTRAPAGQRQIEVSFTLTRDCQVAVTYRDPQSGEPRVAELESAESIMPLLARLG